MWKTLNKIHKLNSSSTVVTWSAICSRFSVSATPVTCDSLSFKNTHPITTMKSCLTWFTTRNYFLLNFKGNYHVQRTLPGIPVMNKTHPIKVPHLSILIQNLYYIQTSMWQHSQYSYQYIHWKICRSNLCRSKRAISSAKHADQLQCPPSLQLNGNHSFISGSNVARADSLTTDSLTTHVHLEASLKIRGALPPLNLSAATAHIGTT